jgi:hypothetical protein
MSVTNGLFCGYRCSRIQVLTLCVAMNGNFNDYRKLSFFGDYITRCRMQKVFFIVKAQKFHFSSFLALKCLI